LSSKGFQLILFAMCVSWQEVVGKASNSRVFYVTDNNADPTGYYDSTRALQATINQAFNVPTHRELLPGIPDLGGVEIHLEGGDYLISSPLQFPSKGGGNLVVLFLTNYHYVQISVILHVAIGFI
jgi:hypothetical protein